MQLLHPYMPFVTEEIYHLLREQNDDLCVKQFSNTVVSNQMLLQQANVLKDTITAIRDVRNKQQIKPKETIGLFIQTAEASVFDSIREILARQVNASAITFTNEAIPGSITLVQGKHKDYITTDQPLNTSAKKDELLKDLTYLQWFLQSVEKKLSNEKFVQNAKPEVVALEQKKRDDAQNKLRILEESLAAL